MKSKHCVFLSAAITLFLLTSPTLSENYLSDLEAQIRYADEFMNAGNYLRAIHLHGKIAKDENNPTTVQIQSWEKIALLQETKLFDYAKAVDAYSILLNRHNSETSTSHLRQKLEYLASEIKKYQVPNNTLDSIYYENSITPEKATNDILALKSILKNYPDYYKKSHVYALLGNRFLNLSQWGHAAFYCYWAQRSNPFLKDHSPLFQDYKKSTYTFLKSWSTLFAYSYLLCCLLFCLFSLKFLPSVYAQRKHLAITIGTWLLISSSLFGLYRLMNLPIPLSKKEQFNEPVIIINSIYPLLSPTFGWFLIYTSTSIIMSFWINFIIQKKIRTTWGLTFSVLNSLFSISVFLAVFYFQHLKSHFYEGHHFYFRAEIEDYVPKYPDFFKDYPDLIK